MTDYSKDSKTIAVTTINADHGTFITNGDVDFISIVSNESGPYNTSVTLLARENGAYRDSQVINYNRTPLNQTFTQPIIYMTLGNIQTTADLIARINTLYGRALSTDDVISESVVPAPVSDTVALFTLKAAPGSLAYTGTVDVYFTTTAALREWIRSPTYEYSVDATSISISGSLIRAEDEVLLGKKGTVTPNANTVALTLNDAGTFSLVASLPSSNKVIARFNQGQLTEVLGPSGETSYDSTGNLLPAMPSLPPAFDSLMATFDYSGTISSGKMLFTTDYSVEEFFYPFGYAYYVDTVNGNNTADGLTQATALKSLSAALNKSPMATTIYLKGGTTDTLETVINARQLTLISKDNSPAILSGALSVTAWATAAQTNTYSFATPAGVAGVVDYSLVNSLGEPARLPLAVSAAALGTLNTGGYFSDGTTLYVRTANGRKPDADVKVIKSNTGVAVTGKSVIYLGNINVVDTHFGIVAESLDTTNKPTVYGKDLLVKTTASLSNVNAFGANVYLENVVGQYGLTGGSSYGGDRQSISLGIASEFIELNCSFSGFSVAGSVGSTAKRNSKGIRFNSTYQHCNGFLVQDFGVGTATANFNVYAANNQLTDVKAGALFASGSDTSGVDGRSVQLILSTIASNPNAFTFVTLGNGEQHLYDAPVGPLAQYGKASPYNFVYSALNQ